MKWIKASERLPEKAKDISVDPGVIFRKISRTNTFVCHTSIRSFSFMGQNLEEWEWLDESPNSEAVGWVNVQDNSDGFRRFLDVKNIKWKPNEHGTLVPSGTDLYWLGRTAEHFKQFETHKPVKSQP